MAVAWSKLETKVEYTDNSRLGIAGTVQKKAGTGKPKCKSCGYHIRGKVEDHEAGPHHSRPKSM